jgi:hypothetical protein
MHSLHYLFVFPRLWWSWSSMQQGSHKKNFLLRQGWPNGSYRTYIQSQSFSHRRTSLNIGNFRYSAVLNPIGSLRAPVSVFPLRISASLSHSGGRSRHWRLPAPDSKIWSRFPWDSEARITVLARASSNLAVSMSSCTTPRVVRQKNTAKSPVEAGTKNNCAGEGQQQFTRTEL